MKSYLSLRTDKETTTGIEFIITSNERFIEGNWNRAIFCQIYNEDGRQRKKIKIRAKHSLISYFRFLNFLKRKPNPINKRKGTAVPINALAIDLLTL